jgi:hypothetical protein
MATTIPVAFLTGGNPVKIDLFSVNLYQNFFGSMRSGCAARPAGMMSAARSPPPFRGASSVRDTV